MRVLTIAAALLLAGCNETMSNVDAAATAGAAMPVQLKAADGVTVFGRYYPAAKPKAIVLLFHQAGSSKDEYAAIAPRLAAAGYAALAIDQRSGGTLFGRNETAAALSGAAATAAEGDAGFLAALPDLQAALDWARATNLPIVVWGSSYSASLVFLLAAANPGKVRAVMAFSPGEYFPDSGIVRRAAARVAVPVFVTSAGSGDDLAKAQAVFDAVPGNEKMGYAPKTGVHGASTLIAARDPGGAAANWMPVLAFLKHVAP